MEVCGGGGGAAVGGLFSKIGLDLGVSNKAGLEAAAAAVMAAERPFTFVAAAAVGRNTEAREGSFMRSLRSTEGCVF